jgi:hypothetical protein
MDRKRLATWLPAWAAILATGVGACPAMLAGCGAGVYDGLGRTQVTKIIPIDGGNVVLGQARFTIGTNTLDVPTEVILSRIPTIAHTGAYGPVFQIDVPSGSVFHQDATFELTVDSIGANQPTLTLGSLDGSQSLAIQQWVPISGSVLNSNQTQLTGSIHRLASMTALQLGAIVKCPPTTTCPAGQACNSGACQQCPTGSTCP